MMNILIKRYDELCDLTYLIWILYKRNIVILKISFKAYNFYSSLILDCINITNKTIFANLIDLSKIIIFLLILILNIKDFLSYIK